ncbi:hypothetical protein OESDEN_06410 [Oesophagostomum dentatum]|uniref:7TM chemoreceptor n=1 Tax=Oesophagostomum dentatum TaxID=61180 RepID=A0A0B1T820_OESDE|nr:hypothetical protein OESDEN_06410 [Oesophagostomum dentatum]
MPFLAIYTSQVLLSLVGDADIDVRKKLQEAVRYYINDGAVSAILRPTDWKCLYTQIHMCIPVIPVYAAILVLRRNIIVKLQTETMSEKTRLMHSQLLKRQFQAITIQACMPVLFVFAVANFVLSELDIYHSPLLEFSTYLSIGFIPVLTPLISLYFIAPYRKWLTAKLQCASPIQGTVFVQFSFSNAVKM